MVFIGTISNVAVDKRSFLYAIFQQTPPLHYYTAENKRSTIANATDETDDNLLCTQSYIDSLPGAHTSSIQPFIHPSDD